MSIDRSLEPPRRVTPLRGGGAWCAILFALLSGSCMFDLPPVAKGLGDGIGGSAGLENVGGSLPTAGSSGEPGGSTGTGGSAGNAGSTGCPADQKLCGGECVAASPENGCASTSCEPCPGAQHALVGCQEGQCAVLSCDAGFADCDGDTLGKAGVAEGTGCEYSLGTPAPSVASLSVPLHHITVDGKRDDWSGVASYTFDKTCNDCRDQQTPPISADATVPPREDLDARFRVAWDGDKFYVLVEAFDNQPYDAGAEGNGCQQAADCEDAVQVFFAGRENFTNGYFNDNQRVFLGLSERFGAPGQGQPAPGDVEIKSERQGNRCYRIEAQIDWGYITSVKNQPADPEHFPAAPGNTYGFDIALNDWDAPISDPNGIQRQSQIFWVDPGPNYANKPEQIGTMQLLGSGDAGQ